MIMKPCEWKTQNKLIGYQDALKWMEKRVDDLQKSKAPECAWLLEHPSIYTLGASGKETDVLDSTKFPLFRTQRGGQVTYHGPGQRVIYLMLDLRAQMQDLHSYRTTLEEWIIKALDDYGIKGERRPGRVGIWVQKGGVDHKIAAFGIRVQKGITSHGIALNVNVDLEAYGGIIPCGLSHYGVTSFADLGRIVTLREVDATLKRTFPFGPCVS